MSTPSTPLTLEQRILLAVQQSEQIVQMFSPGAALLIQSGVEVEPIISGFVHMIAALFHHHVSQAVPAPAPATPAPAPVTQ